MSENTRDVPLQAVVFADSFTETFRPITLDLPKVLLPLANVPMLEYSLEFLAASGVQEVLLFCTSHSARIERFIHSESQVAKRLNVQCIASPTCGTAGDALRELDRRQLVQSNPFVLMSGDVVANVDLRTIIVEHQRRQRMDANCIMTSVFKELRPSCTTSVRPVDTDLVVGIDAATSQLVLYDDAPTSSRLRLPTLFLDQHAQLAVRRDLLDCYLDVCSLDVLVKFAEDFDYQDVRRDFLHNEVQNYEVGKTFFAKVVTEDFAARVMDPRTYAGVSWAILQRWVFPMVPDANYLGRVSHYAYVRGMRYKDAHVTLARTCEVQRECLLGTGTTIGDQTRVLQSVIGTDCTIGHHVVIEGSFVWSNVIVEDNAVVTRAILCDNVVIKRGAVIGEGCILSFGVVIGEDFTVKPFTKVTKSVGKMEPDGFGSDDEDPTFGTRNHAVNPDVLQWNPKDVGVNGVGRVWTLDEDEIEVESESDEDWTDATRQARRWAKLKGHLIGAPDVVVAKRRRWDEWDTLTSSEEEDDDMGTKDQALDVPFQQIIRENVATGEAAGHDVDDLFMEIKSFKFAQNRSFADVIQAIVPGLLDLVPTGNGQSALTILGTVRIKFQRWHAVIQRCLVEHDDQRAIVDALESYCTESEARRRVWLPLFRFLLQTVYELEWVSDDVILEWYKAKQATVDEKDSVDNLRTASNKDVQEFIDWLQDSDDEASDDEDSTEE